MDGSTGVVIGIPTRNRPELANECIECFLSACAHDIVVVDDASDLKCEYISSPRVTVIRNTHKSGFASLANQCIESKNDSLAIVSSDKVRPAKGDIEHIESHLRQGYGLVCTNRMHIFGFDKALVPRVGMFDTGYVSNGYEDTDFMNKFFMKDLGFVFDVFTPLVAVGTSWGNNAPANQSYYGSKWLEDWPNRTLTQTKDDENSSVRVRYEQAPYGLGPCSYLSFSKSILNDDNVRKYYDGLIGKVGF